MAAHRREPTSSWWASDLATTPGKVVFRNRLMELFQYAPATASVRPEPVLIVPAWIMKYYILDLAPDDSLVRYLVGQGFTVFMVSWKNPGSLTTATSALKTIALGADRGARRDLPHPSRAQSAWRGLLPRRDAARRSPQRPWRATGTTRLATMSLLAAQTDFTEAGELTLFVGESQIAFLEDMMWEQGFLDAGQMAGAFQLLRSNDLIWSRWCATICWASAADVRHAGLECRCHAHAIPHAREYLRRLFLDNDLAEGRYVAGGPRLPFRTSASYALPSAPRRTTSPRGARYTKRTS